MVGFGLAWLGFGLVWWLAWLWAWFGLVVVGGSPQLLRLPFAEEPGIRRNQTDSDGLRRVQKGPEGMRMDQKGSHLQLRRFPFEEEPVERAELVEDFLVGRVL